MRRQSEKQGAFPFLGLLFVSMWSTISCILLIPFHYFMSNLRSSLTRMNLSKMSKLGHPCNKLHAVSLVAAHSTRDVKQNVQDLPSLTHLHGKNRSFQNLRYLQTKVPHHCSDVQVVMGGFLMMFFGLTFKRQSACCQRLMFLSGKSHTLCNCPC